MALDRWRRGAWIPLGALAVGALVSISPWQQVLSRPIGDALQRLLAPAQPPAGVLVIDVDDASVSALGGQLGPWPFRRDVHALAIEHLRELGARVIVLNLLMIEPREGDAALARALARPGAPVVLAAASLYPPGEPQAPPARAGEPAVPAVAWPAVVQPVASLWPAPEQPPRMGIATTPLDSDGLLRSLPLWHAAAGRRWPSLALAAWQAQADAATSADSAADWPLDAAGRVGLLIPEPAGQAPVIPFERLWRSALRGPPDPDLARAVRDSVVFCGSSALVAERVLTVNGQRDGTQVLALAYAALRDGSMLRPAPGVAQALLLLLAALPAIAVWRGHAVAPGRALPVAAAAAAGFVLLGAVLLAAWRISVDLAAPLLTLATGTLLSLVAHQRALVAAQRRLVRERAVAAAASEAKTAFLANVSHEIRTPLNAVLGVSELLAGTPLSDEQRRHVHVFQQAGQTLSDLIDDLLDLTKIESGRLEIGCEVFAVRATLERVMALLRPRAQQKGLAFELGVADDVPDRVEGDRPRLEQALTNLLGNAIKFTAQGRVRLDVTVECRDGDPRPLLHFAVSDTGIGIAEDKLGVIFEPFVQADGSVTRNFGGTGLGLAITRAIATLMGGRVSAASTPGQGSVFMLSLPLPVAVEEAADAAAPAATVGERPASTKPATAAADPTCSVMLAEDNEVNVYLFDAMLAGTGLHIDVATDGPTALRMACAGRYDVIFMDVQMPGMDGLSVTRALRRHEAASGLAPTPVVALTANAYAGDLQASLDAGCNMHLPKPFSKAQLLAAVARFAPVRPAPGG